MPIVGRADQVVFVVCVVSLTTDKEHPRAVASGRQGEWLRIPFRRSSGRPCRTWGAPRQRTFVQGVPA